MPGRSFELVERAAEIDCAESTDRRLVGDSRGGVLAVDGGMLRLSSGETLRLASEVDRLTAELDLDLDIPNFLNILLRRGASGDKISGEV